MSSFKKMRIVSNNEEIMQSEKPKLYTESSKHLSRLTDLDNQIKNILNRDIDENEKAKLYASTLRKFITFKRKLEADEDANLEKQIQAISKLSVPVVTSVPVVAKTSKKKKIFKKAKIIHATPKRKTKVNTKILIKAPKKKLKDKKTVETESPKKTKKTEIKKFDWSVLFSGLPKKEPSSTEDDYDSAEDETIGEEPWEMYIN